MLVINKINTRLNVANCLLPGNDARKRGLLTDKLVSTYDPQAYGSTSFHHGDSLGYYQSAEQGDC
jgi:hypothetical protein